MIIDPFWCNSIPQVREYHEQVLQRVFEIQHNLQKHEQVTVSLYLNADGSVARADVVRASSLEAAAVGVHAFQSASPYPPPPLGYRDCLVDTRLLYTLVSYGPVCDTATVLTYANLIAQMIAEALRHDSFSAEPGSGEVSLRLTLDGEGKLEDAGISAAESPEAAAKAVEAAEKLSPFPAPDDSFRYCIEGSPFNIGVKVEGR